MNLPRIVWSFGSTFVFFDLHFFPASQAVTGNVILDLHLSFMSPFGKKEREGKKDGKNKRYVSKEPENHVCLELFV